jgi:hypothetical protein
LGAEILAAAAILQQMVEQQHLNQSLLAALRWCFAAVEVAAAAM